jgi:NAD+ synthase (glutamine-hydrolysing)
MGDVDVPFGPGLLFTATDLPGFVLHVEICVDMFVPVPPVHRPPWPVRRC